MKANDLVATNEGPVRPHERQAGLVVDGITVGRNDGSTWAREGRSVGAPDGVATAVSAVRCAGSWAARRGVEAACVPSDSEGNAVGELMALAPKRGGNLTGLGLSVARCGISSRAETEEVGSGDLTLVEAAIGPDVTHGAELKVESGRAEGRISGTEG